MNGFSHKYKKKSRVRVEYTHVNVKTANLKKNALLIYCHEAGG